eukprot:14173330-Heterocapsa_arctica.AAC.1
MSSSVFPAEVQPHLQEFGRLLYEAGERSLRNRVSETKSKALGIAKNEWMKVCDVMFSSLESKLGNADEDMALTMCSSLQDEERFNTYTDVCNMLIEK